MLQYHKEVAGDSWCLYFVTERGYYHHNCSNDQNEVFRYE